MEHTNRSTPQAPAASSNPTIPARVLAYFREDRRQMEEGATPAESARNRKAYDTLEKKYGAVAMNTFDLLADDVFSAERDAIRAAEPPVDLDAYFSRIVALAGRQSLQLFANHAFARPVRFEAFDFSTLVSFDFSTLAIFGETFPASTPHLAPSVAADLTSTHERALSTPGVGHDGIAKALTAFLAGPEPPKPTTPAPKTIRFMVEASEDVPFAYSAEVQLPADAEAYCREFIRQMESTTRIAPEDVASNAQEGMRMHDKYGEKKLQSFMHATEALVLAENSPTGPNSNPVHVTTPDNPSVSHNLVGFGAWLEAAAFTDWLAKSYPGATWEFLPDDDTFGWMRDRDMLTVIVRAAAGFEWSPNLTETKFGIDQKALARDPADAFKALIDTAYRGLSRRTYGPSPTPPKGGGASAGGALAVSEGPADYPYGSPACYPNGNPFDPANAILLVADEPRFIRSCDVYRLFDETGQRFHAALLAFILASDANDRAKEEARKMARDFEPIKGTRELGHRLDGWGEDESTPDKPIREVSLAFRSGRPARRSSVEDAILGLEKKDWNTPHNLALELGELLTASQPTAQPSTVSESAPSYGTPSTPPRQVSPDMLRAFLADTDDLEDAIDEALGYLNRDDEDDDPDARMARELGEVEDCEESDYFERDLEDVIEDLLNGEGDDFIAMEDAAAYAAAAPALKHSGFKYHVEVTVWADADLRRFTWQLAGQDGAPTRFPFASAAEASKHARRTIKNATGVHEGRRTLHAHLLQELCERMNQPAAQAVSEDGADYPAATPTPNVQDNSPRGSQAPKHAPELVTFFRKVLESGPIGILDQYAIEGDPESFRFSSVTERDRATGNIEYVFSPNEAESLQEEHDNLLGPHRAEDMIEAADAVNKGEAGNPDGDDRPATPAQIHPTTYPDHDDVTTVDVILYEEGTPRTVHVEKNVFGFFAQLRHFLAGTLDSYHPEEGVPTRFKEEHARLMALVGIDAMIDGAIAFEVWASRQELGKEKGTLASIHDNRPEPDPDDDPEEPWRDMDGNAVPDYEEDRAAIEKAISALGTYIDELDEASSRSGRNAESERAREDAESAHNALVGLRSRMDAYAESQENPNPSNAEHLLCRLTRALAAIGFGDPDATYDSTDVLNIADAHWADMLLVTGIDQPAAETAAEVNAYARTTPADTASPTLAKALESLLTHAEALRSFMRPDGEIAQSLFMDSRATIRAAHDALHRYREERRAAAPKPADGHHSSDSLDEARATERANALERAAHDNVDILLAILKRLDLEASERATAGKDGIFPCAAMRDDIRARIDATCKALTTPKRTPNVLGALEAAESFMRGFEDDETQEGVADALTNVRSAIAALKGGN